MALAIGDGSCRVDLTMASSEQENDKSAQWRGGAHSSHWQWQWPSTVSAMIGRSGGGILLIGNFMDKVNPKNFS